MASADPVLRPRFGRTERVLHWAHATAFFGMLATGLLLYLPALAGTLGSRPQVKAVHLAVAIAWLVALVLVAVLGNRRALRSSVRDIDRFDRDDRVWLRHGGRGAPQGRFNAGQKLHTHLQAAFAVLLTISGTLLWLGERNTTFRLSGSIPLHDLTALAAVVLLLGHLWLALIWPATRPALRGITLGTVRTDWAAKHHPKWAAEPEPASAMLAAHRRPRALATGAGILALGLLAGVYVVQDATSGISGTPAAAAAAALSPQATPGPPTAPTGTTSPTPDPAAPSTASTPGVALAGQAQQLQQAGHLAQAITLYRAAVAKLPRRADVRTALALALAASGKTAAAVIQLRRALVVDPSFSDAQVYLGAVLTRTGRTAEGHRELQRYLRRHPSGAGATFARQQLSATAPQP
jgi:formate dehydrogenase subunit gamma